VKGERRPSHTSEQPGVRTRLEFATCSPCLDCGRSNGPRLYPETNTPLVRTVLVVAECNLNLLT